MTYISNHGQYTPTLTNVTNVSASTAYACNYIRVGTLVSVSGRVDIDQTVPGNMAIGISLPFASDFTDAGDLCGTGAGMVVGEEPIFIRADTVNNRADFNGSDTDITNHSHYFMFMYIIKK